MRGFTRSDLAAECGVANGQEGVRVTEGRGSGCEILHVQIKTAQAAARVGKPIGHYVTVDCGDICRLDGSEMERVCRAVGVELRSMAERMCEKRITADFSVLVIGLGNREVTPDSIGPETVRRLSVTRHLELLDGALFSTVGLCKISALIPGVPATTGLETVETVRGIALVTAPDLIVAVDALAARAVDKLGRTVQLSDSGIRPASGLGRHSRALDKETTGVPVLALGIPTVVGSDTLAMDLLSKAGVPAPERDVQDALERSRNYVVSPKEIDLLAMASGVLLSSAIERAFSLP